MSAATAEVRNPLQSRWGFHPCDYSTFRKLKTLKKRYWETVRAYAKYRRWDRKTVHQYGPMPVYCPELQGRSETFFRNLEFVSMFEVARMPSETPVEPWTPETIEAINRAYDRVETWFAEQEALKASKVA